MGMQSRPEWFEFIRVREHHLLGTKVPPDFVISFGPTNIIKAHASAEKAERQIKSIREWLWTHMQKERADAQERERVLRESAKEMYAALILIRAYAIHEMRQQDIDGLEALLEKARAALAQ